MTKKWTGECLECGQRMGGDTRQAVARALEQHIRATSYQAWLLREFSGVSRRVPVRRARKRLRWGEN
jgi:hypothetical protein